jgi:hypothetical protein
LYPSLAKYKVSAFPKPFEAPVIITTFFMSFPPLFGFFVVYYILFIHLCLLSI